MLGCASTPELSQQPMEPPFSDQEEQEKERSGEVEVAQQPQQPQQVEIEPQIFRGNDAGIVLPAPRAPVRLDGEAVMLNFEQAPLNDVIHTILGDTLGLDYVIENKVQGKITLRTRSPIPRDELLPIVESLLRNNNVLMIRGPNDRFFISGAQNIKSTVPRFDSQPAEGYSNVIVPLQYISASEMAEILRPVAREDAFVRVDASRNLLILAGTQIQLEGWLGIIATFDVDQLVGMSVGFFPLNNTTTEDVLAEVEAIMAGAVKEGLPAVGSMVNILPIERLNGLMVISPRAHYVDTVGSWIANLDSLDQGGAESILQVYPVKNGNAAQLASLLSTLYGGGTDGRGSDGVARESVAPGMTTSVAGASGNSSQTRTQGGAAGGTFDFGNDVRVVADEYNNSLLVYAPSMEYKKIARILDQLDVVATQVLIEASIVEVTLRDDLEYGLEWAFDNDLGGGDTGSGLFDLGGGLGPKPGFSYTITDSADAVKAVINTLAERSLINVISTPSVMVLDNHTASIHVGDQQPIQSQSTVTNGGNVLNSITYRDTGVKLQVTPSVNDGGLVTLDIDQSVTDVGPVDAATRQRSFLERNVSSRVAIRSGESVVLGGLIRDNDTEGKSGIPVLMDIPVVGALFSTTTSKTTRTELLIFITPRVMESDADIRGLNTEMRERMRGLTDFSDVPVKFIE
jgi:general secretion pathway protein D